MQPETKAIFFFLSSIYVRDRCNYVSKRQVSRRGVVATSITAAAAADWIYKNGFNQNDVVDATILAFNLLINSKEERSKTLL